MKFIIVVLLICSVLSLVYAHQTTINEKNAEIDKRIDRIINNGYQRLIRDLERNNFMKFDKNGNMVSKNGDLVETKPFHLPSYQCQHDKIIENKKLAHGTNSLKNKMSMTKSKKIGRWTPTDTNTVIDVTVDDVKASVPVPIRIQFNTTYITAQNDLYACYRVGDKVSVGDTGGTRSCGVSSDKACLHTCTDQDIQSTALQNLIAENIVSTIQDILTDKIMVRHPISPIVFNRELTETQFNGVCDYGIDIPDSYFDQGVQNADIVVWVTSRPTAENSTIAYAFACNFPWDENILGRPVGATINFNPIYFNSFIGQENGFTFNEFIRVGIHEMTHALGFSSTFYPSYIDINTGEPYEKGAYSEFIYKDTTPNGDNYQQKRSGIITPGVVDFVREHYQCSSATHSELENYGGAGTAGSHWEKRTVGEEYMLGYVSPIAPITNLTLSLLQDTGWYVVDANNADPLVWGKSLGCQWLGNCKPTTWNYQGYFCQVNGAYACSATRTSKGKCNIITIREYVPPGYQHFTDDHKIGEDLAADGCPFYDFDQNDARTMYCQDTSNQVKSANSAIGETFCDNCRCFEYQDSDNSVGQSCWEQRCNGSALQLNIKGSWVTCPDSTTVQANNVTVICPIGYTICGGSPATIVLASDAISTTSSLLLLVMTSILYLLF
ncbi:peptidase M8 [Tieghemostelium lacteum]|uniref:Peptidase M8 n=1 Tax=Tieghemostelium lacteum TaxID=361077 RepID=A0A151ZD50_TIELA|nr:peptidase M8 [Tieghemostelium lacteum]|eukprot:KYQ91861.1 peptidase M8 [Tieghemostelium lacteum]